jgi:hypothetical protein
MYNFYKPINEKTMSSFDELVVELDHHYLAIYFCFI